MNPSSPTLGDLVAARPDWVPVLESLGLDYCCGGHRTLDDAARDLGLDGATVLRTLRSLPAAGLSPVARNPATLATPDLISHIIATHHAFVRRELPRLQGLASKVVAAHGQSHPELFEVEERVRTLTVDLLTHLEEEEGHLFPQMLAASGLPDALQAALSPFFDDHSEAGASIARVREITAGFTPPHDACVSYRGLLEGLAAFEADLHQHVHLENNVLFPRFGGRP